MRRMTPTSANADKRMARCRVLPRLVLLAVLAAASAPCLAAPPRIAVCLPPQAGILDALQPGAAPLVLIDRGQNPHSFDPSPRQLAELSTCGLYVAAGLPFENALLPRLRALNPAMRIVPAPADEHDHDAPEADEHDPHFWTHPDGILAEARAIAAALSEADPGAAPAVSAALAAYETSLRDLDAALRARLAPLKGRAFLVYHPAWSHFAEEYGLRQLAIEHHGGAPSAKHLARLTDAVRAEGIRLVLVQSDSEAARTRPFADSLGLGTRLVNPLGRDPRQLLRDTADAIEAALPTTHAGP